MGKHKKQKGGKEEKKEKKLPLTAPIRNRVKWFLIGIFVLISVASYLQYPYMIFQTIRWLYSFSNAAATGMDEQRTNLLTTHFLGALSEIATTIPKFDELSLSNDRQQSQYTMRRRQIDMIESLAFTSQKLTGESVLVSQVQSIKEKMYEIHKKTNDAEDSFKEAVVVIDTTSVRIIKELPLLMIHLESGDLNESLELLSEVIASVGGLIKQLEDSTLPVAELRRDMTKLVSEIGLLETSLNYIGHKIDVGLVAHDRHSQEYQSASFFRRPSRPDQEKYENMILVHKSVEDMQLSSRFLDTTFEKSELQIHLAMAHLKSTNRRLTDIYIELSRSSDSILKFSSDHIYFNEKELKRLKISTEETIQKIEQIRRQNEPILDAISIYGYSAIATSPKKINPENNVL